MFVYYSILFIHWSMLHRTLEFFALVKCQIKLFISNTILCSFLNLFNTFSIYFSLLRDILFFREFGVYVNTFPFADDSYYSLYLFSHERVCIVRRKLPWISLTNWLHVLRSCSWLCSKLRKPLARSELRRESVNCSIT